MRIQVNLSDEMVQKADYYSKRMGLTRSGMLAYMIGQSLMTMDKSFEVVDNMGKTVSEKIATSK